MSRFLQKVKAVNLKDIGHIFLFLFAIIPAMRLKRKRPHIWLICEYGEEARDNGYWFFKYLRETKKSQDAVYAIDFKADDYKKVSLLGNCVCYGSYMHWIYYLAAEINISSHKGGKPNAAVCYFLEVYGLLKNKRVFLQHGITKDMAELFFYENTKMRLFICGAKPEYDFVQKNFHYPKGYVVYTGFSRFDNLLKPVKQEREILVAPTWRRWLYNNSSNPYENECENLEETQYFQEWMNFLNDERVENLLDKYDYRLILFPHRNMTSCFEQVESTSERIKIVNWRNEDLQVLMQKSQGMITDYSSVAMDFAYLRKPLLYFQFDYEQYRREHFEEGYFDYDRDGFGVVCRGREQLLAQLEEMLRNNCEIQNDYLKRSDIFFIYRDRHNCDRIYEEIRKTCE